MTALPQEVTRCILAYIVLHWLASAELHGGVETHALGYGRRMGIATVFVVAA